MNKGVLVSLQSHSRAPYQCLSLIAIFLVYPSSDREQIDKIRLLYLFYKILSLYNKKNKDKQYFIGGKNIFTVTI